MAFDVYSYSPGDAWTSTDFISLATTGPRLKTVTTANGQATDGSYFDSRNQAQDPCVEISYATLDAQTATIALQQRHGDTGPWHTIKTYTGPAGYDLFEYRGIFMLRLLRVSGTGDIELRLTQHL